MSHSKKPPRSAPTARHSSTPHSKQQDLSHDASADSVDDPTIDLPLLVPDCLVANANAHELIALSQLNVLLIGETGTGKSQLAQLLHKTAVTRGRSSPNATIVNMAAIPESLAESELFGCVAGAFTHAKASDGILGECNKANDCVVLDEVGHASPEVQAKLLTAIEEGKYYRVGDYKNSNDFKGRVFATASNPEMILPELRFRIGQIQIRVPPLRQDRDRIRRLASQFFTHAMRERWSAEVRLDESTLDDLATRDWPGNIRELQNYTRRLAAFAAPDGTISQSFRQLVDRMGQESAASNALELAFTTLPIGELHIDKVKKRYATAIRSRLRGKLGEAKKVLGVSDDTMRSWLDGASL
jgi:DNA-binding NtrC family response regulator